VRRQLHPRPPAANGIYLDKEGRHDLKVPEGSAEVELVAIDPPLGRAGSCAGRDGAPVHVPRPRHIGHVPGHTRARLLLGRQGQVEQSVCANGRGGAGGTRTRHGRRVHGPLRGRRPGPQEDRQPRQLPHLPCRHARACQSPLAAPPLPDAGCAPVARCAHANARACAPGRQDLGDTGGRQPAPPRRHQGLHCRVRRAPRQVETNHRPRRRHVQQRVASKTFARELAMRGPTPIVSGFYTSKMCPCGTCELEGATRAVRSHWVCITLSGWIVARRCDPHNMLHP